MPKRNATIKDVAATARVSTATVSNVLHGKDTLYTSDTADAVWNAVRDLGYRPNRIARSLVHRQTDTLGVVVDRIHGRLTRNPYTTELLDGFMEYAMEANYQIKLISLQVADLNRALAQLDDGSVDGIALFAPAQDSPLMTWAQTARVPLVFAGSVPPNPAHPAVDMDDEAAAYIAVRKLIEMGHRRIGLIMGPPNQWSALRRESGYQRALGEAGLEARPEWRFVSDYGHGGAAGVEVVMKANPRPTALLCWNDGIALEAMRALQGQGVQVPEEVSLIGFDDMELGRWVHPSLTTVQQPVSDIGGRAAELLIRQIQSGQTGQGVTLLEGTLIIRESVAPPMEGFTAVISSFAVVHPSHTRKVR